MLRATAWAVVLLACAGCASNRFSPPALDPPGPPRVRVDVVRRHASELTEEIGSRPAGSQQEQAAQIYILGHVQRAGYAVRLEGVPVRDLVRSTNVIALPPTGQLPEVIVAVGYDTAGSETDGGDAVGLWLELVRALGAAHPEHSVEFAALGAERTSVRGGSLGSKSLVEMLRDEDARPVVVTLGSIDEKSQTFAADGVGATELHSVARRVGVRQRGAQSVAPSGADVYDAAGIDHVRVSGGVNEVGRVLLEYLSADPQ